MDPLVGLRSGGPDQAPRSRFQQEAFVSPMSLLADFATLSDRIPLVRYAFRAALAEIQGLACLPLSHPEASLPWKSPDTRHHVFEAQVLPMLNSTFRMESHLRVFGLTNQLNIIFKRQRGWRVRPPGNSSSCSSREADVGS